eukprot:s108_g38.t1
MKKCIFKFDMPFAFLPQEIWLSIRLPFPSLLIAMAPKFSKPDPFAHMKPPRGLRGSGYKKHEGGEADMPSGVPSSSDAGRNVADQPTQHPHTSSSEDDSGDENQAGGGGDDPDPDDISSLSGSASEEAEEEEATDDEEVALPSEDMDEKLKVMQCEMDKLAMRCMALELVIQKGFHKSYLVATDDESVGQVLPNDRLELQTMIDRMKLLTKRGNSLMSGLVQSEGFAVYARNVETRETKQINMEASTTVARMKKKVMHAFGLPVSSASERTWTITRGHLSFKNGRVVNPPVTDLDKQKNRLHIKSVMAHTSLIEFSVRGAGGGKTGDRKSQSIKAVIVATTKQERTKVMAKQDMAKVVSVDKMLTAINENMSKIYIKADDDAVAVFRNLLQSLPDDMVGKTMDDSPLVKSINDTNTDTRVEKVVENFLKSVYGALYDMKAEIDTTIEGASLTLELVLSSAFIVEKSGKWSWKSMKDCIEKEQLRRALAKPKPETDEDGDVLMLAESMASMTAS